MSFRSSLSMKPSLFWSIMLKALCEEARRWQITHTDTGHCVSPSYLLELLDLGLVEHGEDVRGGPLAAPLRVLLARGLCPTL